MNINTLELMSIDQSWGHLAVHRRKEDKEAAPSLPAETEKGSMRSPFFMQEKK